MQSRGGWDSRYTRSNPSSETFMYEGALAFDTYNIDFHPYVMDVGCIRNGLYIRPDVQNANMELLKQHFTVGNVLVSKKKDFICHDHSLKDEAQTDEKVLYRIITKSQYIYNKENGIEYFELETAKISFLQLFSKLKLLKTKPAGPVQNGPARFKGGRTNLKAFQGGWNLKKDGYGKIVIGSDNNPTYDVSFCTLEKYNWIDQVLSHL